MLLLMEAASVAAGALVGFVLGLIGGGGSILAVPLLVYGVGMGSAHAAIGTSAIAVALSAFSNLIGHARSGTVRWSCAVIFTAAGVAGAAFGSRLGKSFDGHKLLLLFGVLMLVISASMLLRKPASGDHFVPLSRANASVLVPRLIGAGGMVGLLSGFFGIGGGFLIVPGLMIAARMPMINAIGSSLVAVTAFGTTTAVSYALSGLVDWPIAALFVCGGVGGGILGTGLARRLADQKAVLGKVFALIVALVGLYVVAKALAALTV